MLLFLTSLLLLHSRPHQSLHSQFFSLHFLTNPKSTNYIPSQGTSRIIYSLSLRKSSGPDLILLIILEYLTYRILVYPTSFLNAYLISSCLEAIVPVIKLVKDFSFNNYHLISLLLILAKTFENLFCISRLL